MNRKNIPFIMMLVAGAATCVITLINNYSVLGRLTSLLIVMVVFYFLGSVLKWTLDSFERQNAESMKNQEEGEVIEKEAEENDMNA